MGVTEPELQVEIDYNKKVSDVCVEYFTRVLTSDDPDLGPGSFLELAGTGLRNRRDCPGLPSWVPNIHTIEHGVDVQGLDMKQSFAPIGTPPSAIKDRRNLAVVV